MPKSVNPQVRRYGQDHFWVTIDLGIGEEVIVDPFGIPKTFPLIDYSRPEDILPYFGVLSGAPPYAQSVYEKGEALNDWGTRSFPPGFHP